MSGDQRSASQWDWLENPEAALELYSAERRAFYEWEAMTREWSKATSDLSSKGQKPPKKDKKALKALKKRLDEAARAYETARTRLHEAWSA